MSISVSLRLANQAETFLDSHAVYFLSTFFFINHCFLFSGSPVLSLFVSGHLFEIAQSVALITLTLCCPPLTAAPKGYCTSLVSCAPHTHTHTHTLLECVCVCVDSTHFVSVRHQGSVALIGNKLD